MPNLQKELIEQGTTFRNAFVHTPICCPSRSTVLTGRYLHNGCAINNTVEGNCYGEDWKVNAERRTFAVHAKENGYVTGYAGKYLNMYGVKEDRRGEVPAVPPGWDYWYGLVGNSRYYNYDVVQSDDGGNHSSVRHYGSDYHRDYFPDVVANRTLQLINKFTRRTPSTSSPFLLVNAWPTPHAPFTPAPWSIPSSHHHQQGQAPKAPRTPNWNASTSFMSTKHWIIKRLPPLDQSSESFIDSAYANRTYSLRSVDDHIAQIMSSLRGGDDNTYVIYTSDNGFQLGQHRLPGDKRHLYEYDVRVPFIVFGPDVPKNVTVDDLVSSVDIAPTVYDIMTNGRRQQEKTEEGHDNGDDCDEGGDGKVDLPEDMDGISMMPYLRSLYRQQQQDQERKKTHEEKGIDEKTLHQGNGHEVSNERKFIRIADDDHNNKDNYNKNKMETNSKKAKEAEALPTSPSPDTTSTNTRNEVLISYHGEGQSPCGMVECPDIPISNLKWWVDSWNNTYHCLRTIRATSSLSFNEGVDNTDSFIHGRTGTSLVVDLAVIDAGRTSSGDFDTKETTGQTFSPGLEYSRKMMNVDHDYDENETTEENSIYCRFVDDVNFVEYYDMLEDPYQLRNSQDQLDIKKRLYYEKRIDELLACQGRRCRHLAM